MKEFSTWHKKIALTLLLLCVILLYCGSLPKEFTNWDDDLYITNNPAIRSLNLHNYQRLVADSFVANYLPVTMISYALDYQLWKLNATGYHFHNVALHLGCILLVYLILKKMGYANWSLFLPVALFALHPTNVESVSWASERKNLLAALFFLASFHQYLQFREKKGRVQYLSSVLFFLLSLLSKAAAVTAPALFLAYDYFFHCRKVRELRLYDKIPFLVLAETMSFWTIHAAQTEKTLHSYHDAGVWLNVLNIPRLIIEYFQILLFPVNISATYIEHTALSYKALALWVAIPVILIPAWFLLRNNRRLFFWFLFFILLMVPVFNIVPLPIKMANRYLFLPQIGIWIIGTALILQILRTLQRLPILKLFAIICFGLWIVWLCQVTWRFTAVWRNNETLWTDSARVDINNATAQYNLGYYYTQIGQLNRGAVLLVNSILLSPNTPGAHNGLGYYFYLNRRFNSAISEFQTALRISPDFDPALNNLGKVFIEKGESEMALYYFHRAILVNPQNKTAYSNLLAFHSKNHQWEFANEIAEIMIRKFPEDANPWAVFAETNSRKGKNEVAAKAWNEYLKRAEIDPVLRGQIEQKIKSLLSHQ